MKCVVLAGVLSACAAPALAQVYLSDTFDGPGATSGDDAGVLHDVAFHGLGAAPALSVEQVDGRGGVLRAAMGQGDRYATSPFAAAPLVPNSSVTFRFDIRGVGVPDLSNLGIGLYDSRGTGVTDGSAASVAAADDDDGILLTLLNSGFYSSVARRDVPPAMSGNDSGAFIGAVAWGDGAWHTLELVITRGAGEFSTVTFSIDGVLTQGGWGPIVAPTGFDTLQFSMLERAGGAVEFDNIVVRGPVVPAPAGAAVLVPALAAAWRRRRSGLVGRVE